MFDRLRLLPIESRCGAPGEEGGASTAGQAKARRYSLANATILAVCAAVAGYAPPAKADIVYITVVGTVASGLDGAGDFGAAGANLAGAAYTAQYAFDTSVGAYNSPTYVYAFGGSEIPLPTPSLGASLTINGHTFSVAGSYLGDIYNYIPSTSAEFHAEADDPTVTLFNDTIGPAPYTPASITTPLNINAANQRSEGTFSDGSLTSLSLSLTTYTESVSAQTSAPTAAPEPASMAMLVTAMAGLGVIRRKRA